MTQKQRDDILRENVNRAREERAREERAREERAREERALDTIILLCLLPDDMFEKVCQELETK